MHIVISQDFQASPALGAIVASTSISSLSTRWRLMDIHIIDFFLRCKVSISLCSILASEHDQTRAIRARAIGICSHVSQELEDDVTCISTESVRDRASETKQSVRRFERRHEEWHLTVRAVDSDHPRKKRD